MTRRRISIFTLLLLASAAAAAAQPPGQCAEQSGGAHDPGARLERVAERLDLTDGQRAALQSTMTAHRESMEPLRESIRDARQALDRAVRAETLDEAAIRAASDSLSALMADRAVERATVAQELRSFLDPEQVERLLAHGPRRGGPDGVRGRGRGQRGQRGQRGAVDRGF